MGIIEITVILLVFNIIVTCFFVARVTKLNKMSLQNATVHYTLYIGTNDKDTYKEKMPADEARQIVDKICTKYVKRFTIQDATGTWNDEKNIVTHENTIVCYLDDIDEKMLYDICNEIRDALKQNTVLIQKEYTQLDFYYGE